jgi:hypothetical protein
MSDLVTGIDDLAAEIGTQMAATRDLVNGLSSQSLTFANPLAVRFDRPYTHYPPQTVSGPISFSADSAGAMPGATSVIRLTANGTNVPTFTGIKTLDGLAYDNRPGAVNYLQFTALGAPGSLEFFVSYLQERNQVIPLTLAGSQLLFATRTSGITEAAGSYSVASSSPWSQHMLGSLSLAPNTDGWFAVDNGAGFSGIGSMIGFNAANTNQPYANYLYWGFINFGNIVHGIGGATTSTAIPGTRFNRLKRTNGVITFETSSNGSTWTVAHTWAASNQNRLYVQSNFKDPATAIAYTHQGLA